MADKVPEAAVANAASGGEGGDGKVSMQTANYRSAGDNEPSCASCDAYSPPNVCSRVNGSVSPAGTCDLYAKKRDAQDVANEMFGGPALEQMK